MAPSDPLAEAKRLLGRDPKRALAAARAAHAASPTPAATLLLGTAARRAGQPQQAIALLAPLADAAPRAWGVQHEIGVALASVGDVAGGIAALERAVAANPAATAPRHALRDLYAMTNAGATEPPIAALDDSSLHDAVVALLDDREGADDVLLRSFAFDRHDPVAACLIADVAARLGRGADTVALLTDALAMAPAYHPARFRLAEALYRASRDAEALAAIQPLVDAVSAPSIRALRGAVLMRLGREDAALADLTAVTAADPTRATSWLAQGHAHRVLGERDAAIAAYRQTLAIQPDLAEAWWSMADLKTAPFDAADRRAMTMLTGDAELPTLTRSLAHFALGRAHEDAGDHEAAFAHYATANALRRAAEPYDDAADRSFVERLIATTDAAFFAARAGWGDPGQGPIFVVGMPRSGSTLIEQILAAHSLVEGLSELPDIPNLARTIPHYPTGLANLSRDTADAAGAAYVRGVRARQRTAAPFVVDKFPGNAFHAALIHLILPNARIVDVRRDPLDCCVSLFSQSFAEGQRYSYDLADLGRHYRRYVAAMRHVDAMLPGRVLRIDYEALVDDLEGQTRRLLEHCGLAFEPATMRFHEQRRAVRTASSEQVRQPLYRRSIGRWRRFAPWLGPLQEALAATEI